MISILFSCIGNSCRSQIAEGFARKFGLLDLNIQSAGPKPTYAINNSAIAVMKELDIDISGQHPKYLTEKILKRVTHIISIGYEFEDSCPIPLENVTVETWDIKDPVGKDLETFRQVRNQIQQKVLELLTRLNVLRHEP